VDQRREYKSPGSKTEPVTTPTTFVYVVGTEATAAAKRTITSSAKNVNARIPPLRKTLKRAIAATNAVANVPNLLTQPTDIAMTIIITVGVAGTQAIAVG